jgi:2-dehydropantoate 2-reductase
VTTVAILGPGGVGGFLAGALSRAGTPVTVVAREETAALIARDGIRVESVRLGSFTARAPAVAELDTPADVLVVAVKAPALDFAVGRIHAEPALVVPLLNGIEHVERLRGRFGDRVVAGSIRIGAERTAPGHVVHSSPLFRVELARSAGSEAFAHVLRAAELPCGIVDREVDVLWSKFVRLCPLALATAASAMTIGEVRSHPGWRSHLADAVMEVGRVARAEGAEVDEGEVLEELYELAPDHTSSLARDVAALRPNELDAIGGALLRAAARHDIDCPVVEQLVQVVEHRVA